jgi:hypothetical protein
MGLGVRFAPQVCGGGRLSGDLTTTFTDLGTSLFSLTATTVQVAGADQTGFVVFSPYKFNWVSANFTTAETDNDSGTENDHTVAYWNGTSFTTIATAATLKDDFTKTNAVWAAEEKSFVWLPAINWAVTKANDIAQIPAGVYVLSFTTAEKEANDVAAIVTGVEIGSMECGEGIVDNDFLYNTEASVYCPHADALVAFFSTANAANSVSVEFETA